MNKIIIDKEVLKIDGWFDALKLKNKNCIDCNRKITIKTFGLLNKKQGVFCNNTFCLMHYYNLTHA